MTLTAFREHLISLGAPAAVWCVIQSEMSQEHLEYNSNGFSDFHPEPPSGPNLYSLNAWSI